MTRYTRKELRSMIFGTLLGDSWVTKYGHIGCEQVTLELIDYKRKILEQLLGREFNISTREPRHSFINGRKVNSKRTFMIRACAPHLKKYYRILYRDGRKRLTYSLLRRLSPQGIALWLMDDGYLEYRKSNCTRYIKLCTDSFTEEEHLLIIRYFKEYHSIECFISHHTRRKGATPAMRIAFNGKNAQKLVALVYQYVLPCFFYKIDLHYTRMDSINIHPQYREAIKYILQHRTLSTGNEDIV